MGIIHAFAQFMGIYENLCKSIGIYEIDGDLRTSVKIERNINEIN